MPILRLLCLFFFFPFLEYKEDLICCFFLPFLVAFLFNWIGFFLSFCLTTSAAGRYGAISGFGLSLIKWILIVRVSCVVQKHILVLFFFFPDSFLFCLYKCYLWQIWLFLMLKWILSFLFIEDRALLSFCPVYVFICWDYYCNKGDHKLHTQGYLCQAEPHQNVFVCWALTVI